MIIAVTLVACQPALRSERDREVITFESKDSDAHGAITEGELRAELARLRFDREGLSLQAGPVPAELRDGLIERLIERKILLVEAHRLDVKTSTSEASREVQRLEEQLGPSELERRLLGALQTKDDLVRVFQERRTVGKLMAEVAHAGAAVTSAEVEAAWAALTEGDKLRPTRVRASQIVVVTQEEGEQALDELKKKIPFAEVALRHSIAPEAAKGGDLGWIEPEHMPDAFAPLSTLDVGVLSEITSSDYGFHIFRVAEREAARTHTFDELQSDLAANILRAKLERAEAEYVAKVLSRYKIARSKRALARIE